MSDSLGNAALGQLARIVFPPPPRPQRVDWEAVQLQLRSPLPNDYKALVATYGPGSWDDFLHVLQPAHENERIELARQNERRLWALDYLQVRGEPMPYPIGELLAAAATDNGDTVYWLRRPVDDPDAWRIIVNESRGPEWEEYPGGLVDFLTSVLSGDHRCAVFPDDFPSADPTFRPY